MPNENNRDERNETIRGGEGGSEQGPNVRNEGRIQGEESDIGGERRETPRGEFSGGSQSESNRISGTEGGEAQPRPKQRRGFAAMDPAKQKEIASKGGKASHEQGTGHEWDSESAREAGRKGGQASRGGRGKMRSEGGGGAGGGGGGAF